MLIEHLKENGYMIPDDISVIGFDNYVPDMNKGIALTSYEIDINVMISKTIELMTLRLRNPDNPYGAAMIRGRLIDGETVMTI